MLLESEAEHPLTVPEVHSVQSNMEASPLWTELLVCMP
jgi:hypothetical protein